MSIFKNALNKGKKGLIKHNVKEAVNKKLGLNGEHDEVIDGIADKRIDKVGVDNIMKARKIIKTLKE